jgi:hypothetical protein
MKGTMSELELSMFRQRSQEALKQKARRGALVLGVAAGYVKTSRDRIEKDGPVQRAWPGREGRGLVCSAGWGRWVAERFGRPLPGAAGGGQGQGRAA